MSENGALLKVEDLEVAYGSITALHGISIEVHAGEIVTLIGANGAGKSTLLRAISGLVSPRRGRILFRDVDLTSLPAHRIVELGVAHVPEGRGIFANLTVMENLKLATWTRRDRAALQRDYERVFAIFPRLAERRHQLAGTLSGGEQQMLAVARALMMRGQLMLLDEPSMGLAPVLVREIFNTLREINASGATILLVEQNARQALKLAHRGYVLETGRIVLSGSAEELMENPQVKAAYLGG
uniref:Branched-chain amino acid transport system ATP-binding protein n=1 Tax=uncultured Chloroflexota bacterium TaxID=166587 RepID=H5SCX8_9CHLR|nr:branched-chain amino acid transport system ATP-binding protein [uncultured Chloroflexota bacterium]